MKQAELNHAFSYDEKTAKAAKRNGDVESGPSDRVSSAKDDLVVFRR
jgi:hypothetical protein